MSNAGTHHDLVATIEATYRPIVPRIAPEPGFASQLIAEREHLPTQRARRTAPLASAIAAYAQGERRDQRRLPHGFFRSAEA